MNRFPTLLGLAALGFASAAPVADAKPSFPIVLEGVFTDAQTGVVTFSYSFEIRRAQVHMDITGDLGYWRYDPFNRVLHLDFSNSAGTTFLLDVTPNGCGAGSESLRGDVLDVNGQLTGVWEGCAYR